jgi:hypothetical protein
MKQTVLENLIAALLPYIDRSKISDTALQNIVEEHVLMEREQALRDMMKGDEELGLYKTE